MTLLKDIEKYFGTKDLYDVLGIDKKATGDQIKKAYRKASLKIHPDRVGDSLKDEATKKFQVLAQVHFVLSDDERRKLYDQQGFIASERCLDDQTDWLDYWRLLFPRVTEKDITKFYEKYIGSEEEENDLISTYTKYEGDLDKISDAHIGYDEERTVRDLKRLLKEGKISEYDNFVNEPSLKKAKRMRKYKREAKEAAQAKEETNFDELTAMIQKKNDNTFNNMISNLEAKYCNKGTKRKRSQR